MQSNDQSLARQVTVRHLERTCVIEVGGELDLVGGYDLRQALTAALQSAVGAVALDLSSVTAVDDQGLASLEWCSAQAVETRRVLTWIHCSQPFLRDLRARLEASHRASRTD